MPLPTIDRLLSGEEDRPRYVKGFSFDGQTVRVILSSIGRSSVEADCALEAVFPNAVIRRVDESEAIRDEWPLELVSLVCEPRGKRWNFSLDCATVGWVWESDWPTGKTRIGNGTIEENISAAELARIYNR